MKVKSTGLGEAKMGEWCRGVGRLNALKEEVKPRRGEGMEVGSWGGDKGMGQLGVAGGVPIAASLTRYPGLVEERRSRDELAVGHVWQSFPSRCESIKAPLLLRCSGARFVPGLEGVQGWVGAPGRGDRTAGDH